jgi:hypothetical protein
VSEGPIKAWRDSWKPPVVSTPAGTALHLAGDPGRAYCGRRKVALATTPGEVTCSDCAAARAADEVA